jgi:serine/threonine-protein kinase
MNAERLQQIESLFHAALERAEDERAAYLREACGGDELLRNEVETLLMHGKKASGFIELPAMQLAARELARDEVEGHSRTMAAWTGARLGPYLLLAPIGVGGMGEVWKARDTRLNRVVAVKRLKQGTGSRFQQEARAIAALNHPHICQIHDIGPDYLVLEYIEGQPLRGPQAVDQAVRLATQIAEALESAHRKGVVHRDLKPPNILVTSEGSVKLLDFGLAKLVEHIEVAEDATTCTRVPMTEPGTVMGTAPYMSPEQVEGKAVDARSDIFSFGAVLYELLSGRQAFRGENAVSTMAAILHREPAPLDAPVALQQIVKQCLAKPPGQRYQTMAEVRAALQSISNRAEEIQPSIVVLPFANMSRDADDEYFSDGLAEEIINALTQVSGLRVIARTSAFAFKRKHEDIRKIAQTLGVANVLGGSVRRAGSRLRVTAQLIQAADGANLWSQRYDRELTDVFALQDEIAAAIVGTLRVKLAGPTATARAYEPNLRAYEAFLKARHDQHGLLHRRPEEQGLRIEEYYKQAIALDPQWAEPHSALGQYYFFGAVVSSRLNEMISLASAEAWKALALLPSEPLAHAVLGAIAAVHYYDWKHADEQFRLARASESISSSVHQLYAGYYLSPLGRFEEALQQSEKVITHDPLNMLYRGSHLRTLLLGEMFERTIVEAQKVLEFDEWHIAAHSFIALAHFFQGKLAEAREWAEEAFRRTPLNGLAVGLLTGLLKQSSEMERAEKLLTSLRGMGPLGMIIYHLVCSEIDAAIDCYESSIEQRQPIAAQWAAAGFFRPLRSNPRWPKLARKMNLVGPLSM